MASSFMGLYVQREALISAQKALDITGNNITNVNTAGYSRQRLDVCSVANTGYNLFYNTSTSLAGQGVDPVGVAQYRDSLIDTKVRTYTTSTSEMGVKCTVMSDVETALDNIESEQFGFATTLAEFEEALQSFSSDNADRETMANISVEKAKALIQHLSSLNARLDEISLQVLSDTESTVTSVNDILANMGSLNRQITDSYISMGFISSDTGNYVVDNDYGPLELKDQMNNFIDELSQYGNVTFKEETNGSFTVTFAGQVVLHNDAYAQMAMTTENPEPFDMEFCISNAGTYDAATDSYSGLKKSDEWREIKYAHGNTPAYVRQSADKVDISSTDTLKSGALRGYIDTYNGDGIFAPEGENNYQGVEYYRDMLNAFAKTFSEEFNKVFETDFGFKLFTYDDDTGTENFHTAAENLRVSDEWLNNPELISKPESFNGTAPVYDELDNKYINKMLGVFSKDFTYGYTDAAGKLHNDPTTSDFKEFIAHISDNLGSQVQSEKKLLQTTNIMLNSVVDARDEIMGVSIDEEGVNMLSQQKWYNAIARMITTLDEALDKVINGMGIVGL